MADLSRLRDQLSHREFERILLIKPSSLGDIIHALPVLHGLRARYPRSRIDWLVNAALAPIIEGHPEITSVILFDRHRFARMVGSRRALGDFVAFVRGLRSSRYDLVIDLQGLFRTGFLSLMTGSPVRVGFREGREGAWLFYSHRLPRCGADTHAVDRNMQVASVLAFEKTGVQFRLPIGVRSRENARKLFDSIADRPGVRILAVVPGARWETKVWPAERFVQTIDQLHADSDLRCVLLGGKDETRLCEGIAAACRVAPLNLAGQTDLKQLETAIAAADAVLCHDSAAAHLAVAFDRPLVCITGPTNPHRTGPYNRLQDVVRLDLECSPCYLRYLSHCRYGHRCMEELDVERVVSAVRRALGRPM